MKVAFLSFYSGEVHRGVETFVHELANQLTTKGVEVLVFQNGPELKNAKYTSTSINLNVDWKQPSSGAKFVNYWAWLIKDFTHDVLNQMPEDVDIVIPTNGEWQVVLCKLWCLQNKKKLVVSGQSGVGLDERINLYAFPDAFVSLTRYQMKRSKKRNPRLNHTVIPNGVDLESFSSAKKIGVELPKPIIMTASALVPMKRIDLIIKAVAETNASLLIVGQGEEEENLRKLSEKLLLGRYKIINLPYHKIASAYRSCDLFTFATSSWESFGIVLVEAMASGLGVVATNDPIRREIVGDAGLLVDPVDTKKYTEELNRALKIDWKEKSQKQAKKFSWDIIADKYIELFNTLL